MALSIPIPDNVRPYLALLAKYHFWILAALVPLIVFPFVAAGNGWLGKDIASKRNQIDGKLSQIKRVAGISPHPNEKWSAVIDARTADIAAETLAERHRLWYSERGMRVWSSELGEDFLAAVAVLAPDGKLDRPMLRRYQQIVPRLVRGLPARMGVKDEMVTTETSDSDPGDKPVEDPSRPLTWSSADQRSLYASFNWPSQPSTAQVLLAQEELWVYGTLCDAIASFNRGSSGRHDVAITAVQQFVVGYRAAQIIAGSGGGRIIVPAADGSAPAEGGLPTLQSIAEPAAADPGNPRFGGSKGGGEAKDEDFRNWIYVDFDGKPVAGADLASKPGVNMVHLMPFVLNIVIDQRRLDGLLTTLATWPIPLEVREVRINVGGASVAAAAQPVAEPAADSAADSGGVGGRRHDIQVELRGTVALATKPAEAAPAPGDGAGVRPARAAPEMPGLAPGPSPKLARKTTLARGRTRPTTSVSLGRDDDHGRMVPRRMGNVPERRS